MREHRNALRAEWAKLGRPPLIARTGINSGLMLVGNLGSKYRFAYGVLGDNVNLGFRLEGLNKELLARSGTSLLRAQEKAFSAYAAGLEAYRQQRWDEALGLFEVRRCF